ncbi:MAG: hypothetical protein DRO52_02440 [Candidatus Hecatellales archaeon]|nr:MAG: hypothetical protein DRO52_02440 [Candidatus Hecatellales archaeon]
MAGREFWSRMAEGYDEWFRVEAGPLIYEAEASALRRMAEELKPGLMLDVGCGTGLFSQVFRELGWRVLGVDYALGMVSRASARGLEVVLADGLHLPFRPSLFDSVLLFTVLEFLSSEEEALKEVCRVLKPGGSLILGVHNRVNPWNLYRRFKAGRKSSSAYKNVRFYGPLGLKEKLERFSLKPCKSTSVVFHPKTLRLERWLRRLGLEAGWFGSILLLRAVKVHP